MTQLTADNLNIVDSGTSPSMVVTVPTRDCYLHGPHSAWVQFRITDDPKPPHFCMLCIVDLLRRNEIGQAND